MEARPVRGQFSLHGTGAFFAGALRPGATTFLPALLCTLLAAPASLAHADGVGSATRPQPNRHLATTSGDAIAFATPTVISITNPGDVATVVFTGSAGQNVSLTIANATYASGVVRLESPGGSVLASTGGSFIDARALPTTGTYTIEVDPDSTYTGNATLTLFDVIDRDGGTIAKDGTAATAANDIPGENGYLTFTGQVGEVVSLLVGNANGLVYVHAPSGATVWHDSMDNRFSDRLILSESGTYQVYLDWSGATVGSVSVRLWEVPPDANGATVPHDGSLFSTANTVPGQNAYFAFSGSAGQIVSLYGRSTDALLTLYAPSGAKVLSMGLAAFTDRVTLNESGTYRLYIDWGTTTVDSVTVQLWNVPPDVQGTIAIGGPPVAIGNTVPAQNAYLTFTGATSQIVSVSVLSGTNYTVTLYSPTGAALWTTTNAITSPTLTLPLSGTYKFTIDWGTTTVNAVTLQLNRPVGWQPLPQTFGTCDGSGLHALSPSVCTADPVNSLTGAFTISAKDLTEASRGVSFAFTRSYTSADATVGRLGPGWTDNYGASLAVQRNGDVLLRGDEGQQVAYTRLADGSFVGAAGALSTLTSIAGGYKLVRHDQVTYTFDANGVLQSEVDRNGQGLTFGYDGSSRLSTITDAAGHAITLGYTSGNLLDSVSTPDGRTVSYAYTNGYLRSVTLPDPDGAGPLGAPVWTYRYDENGRLAQLIDPNGHTDVANVYASASGRVVQQTDGDAKTTQFGWDPSTQTATITDPDNHVWKDVYENDVLTKQIDPSGETTQFGHDPSLDTTSVTAPNGTDTTSMSYQNGNLTQATAPASLGAVQKSFTYDGQNNVRTVTDARQKLSRYGYDAAGNNDSITLDGREVFAATYNALGEMLTSTDGNGGQTTYTYDASGNVTAVTTPDPDGTGPRAASTTTYTYDAMGNVLTKVDPLGNCSGCVAANYRSTYTYDTEGRLLTESDPLGHTTTFAYDAAGNRTSVTDADNHTTMYSYDNADHLIQVREADPDGPGPLAAPAMTYSYDAAGNRVAMVSPRGNCSGCNPSAFTTTYTYDENNRLAAVTTPKGEKTTYGYDPDGNVASVVDPRGNVQGANPDDYKTSYTYDAAGRLLTITDPLGHRSTNHYDAVGNLDWTKDANQHQTSYSYDADGRVVTVTAPDGGVTGYSYDGDGRVEARTDANDHTTSYSYDGAGFLTGVIGPDPDGSGSLAAPVTTYAYDLDGNLVSTTAPNGNATRAADDGITSFGYDRAGRLTAIGYSDSTPPVAFGYDGVGNRTSMSDGSGSVSYAYDDLDRLIRVTRGFNSFSYAYDPDDNITSRSYPDSTQISYLYDENNHIVRVTSGGLTTAYTYDPAGDLTQTMLPGGNDYVETRSYDHAGRLTEVKNAKAGFVLFDDVTTLDAVGNPTEVVRTGALSGTQTFTYDADDRLLSVCFQSGGCPYTGDPFIRWRYDRVGNRLTETRPVSSITYTYNGLDELTQTVAQGSGPNLYSSQAQADGAQPYWRLGETSGSTFASTAGTYNGAWTGSPTLGVAGALGGDSNPAVTFNGTSQYGTVANAGALNKTNNFSLELWLRRSRNAAAQAIAGKPLTTSTKSENYALWIDTANDPRFEVGSGNKSAAVTCTTHPLDTNWHHLVGTFASGTLKLYLDGALCNSASAAFGKAGTNTGTFDVGRSGRANYYGGSLDEIAVYGTALTATQIADHYAKANTAPTTVAYSYDTDGNLTAAGSRTFSYDLANRLLATSIGFGTTSYSYDGDGNRLQASTGTSPSQKINYLWDTSFELPQLALERDGDNALLRRYVYGVHRISMIAGSNAYYYHHDPLGSVANITSASGATEWTDGYEPFGTIHAETQNDPKAPTNVFKFAGEYADPTGLYHLRAREYDPTNGRFQSPDPLAAAELELGRRTSTYGYAGNRPTVMIDPTGMTMVASDAAQTSADLAASPGGGGDADRRLLAVNALRAVPTLTAAQLRNARIIFTLAGARLPRRRSREMVAASYMESTLDARAVNRYSGAAGLFQLLSSGYVQRARALGGVFNPRANTCAILPDYAAYWRRHPNAIPGAGAAAVEASGEGPWFYARPLSWLPQTFAAVVVSPCPG